MNGVKVSLGITAIAIAFVGVIAWYIEHCRMAF